MKPINFLQSALARFFAWADRPRTITVPRWAYRAGLWIAAYFAFLFLVAFLLPFLGRVWAHTLNSFDEVRIRPSISDVNANNTTEKPQK